MKRKTLSLDEQESRLSNLLFNKSNDLAEKLESNTISDVGVEIKPVWVDDDDDQFGANIIPNVKSKGSYTEKLKQKYETLMGTPSWAKLSKQKEKQENEFDSEIVKTVGHLKRKKTAGLQDGLLELKRFPKINEETGNEGPVISCLEFHPKLSATLVAGQSGVVSLFSIGGDVNTKLHSFKLKSWQISAAHFTPDGAEAYIALRQSHSYCVYDLVKAEPKMVQLPQVSKRPILFELSSDGKFLATSDGFEEVYLISVKSKELLKSLRHNTPIKSIVFSHDCDKLYSYSVEGNVIAWDLSTYRVVQKFYDYGCVTASCITTSSCGKLLALGSGEGIVNIYETSKLNVPNPLPLKAISNLTTKITKLKFNGTTEILAASSGHYPNAVKLIHIPSYHVFSNFPKQSSNLYQVDVVNFSPNSGYMGITNNKGCAYLYRLKHYKNY